VIGCLIVFFVAIVATPTYFLTRSEVALWVTLISLAIIFYLVFSAMLDSWEEETKLGMNAATLRSWRRTNDEATKKEV